MTKDEALKLALRALEKCDSALAEELAAWDIDPPLHHVLEASNACGPAITAIKEALAQEKALQALHDENERLGLYKDAYAEPEEEKLHPVHIGVDVTREGTAVTAFYRKPDAVMEMFYSQFHPLAQPEYDYKDLYEKEKRKSAMWLSKYEEVAGPAPKAIPMAKPEQEFVAFSCLRCVTPKKCAIHGCSPNTWPSEALPQRKPLSNEEIYKIYRDCGDLNVKINIARAIEAAHGIKE